MILKIALPFLLTILSVHGQENAANSVSPSLVECYNNTETLDREIRLPTSINVLIALIRKIESGPFRQNDRELAVELIQRFRQDGIMKIDRRNNVAFSIPYSPLGFQADKNRILLRKLIPGNAENFPNSTLSTIERCSMHFMLSNSHYLLTRGDESSVCNALGRFQRRVRRRAKDDIEMFDFSPEKRKGNLREEVERDPNNDVDINVKKVNLPRKTLEFEISQCPLENGVVYTQWGAIQAGTVIAGIAAGREQQFIPEGNYEIDSKFASTLAGDLAEVSLHQTFEQQTFKVGVKGGWNGTQVPRWYFVDRSTELEMTDAEIRAGLDGLILAKNMEAWKNKARLIKVSQVLDMYYSTRGVFSKKYRACNRQSLYYEVANPEELIKQTIGFSFLLDNEAKLLGTITDSKGIETNGKDVVDALNNYITTLQDVRCESDSDTTQRTNVDLVIVLDTDNDFSTVQRALAYLLDNIDINPYESNYTIINAKTGDLMVNSSDTILDFYEMYNKTTHLNVPRGIDVSLVLDTVERMFKAKVNNEIDDKTARGKSTIALFLLYNTLSDSEKTSANIKKEYIKKYLPDLKLLVWGRNAKEAYPDLVYDPANDAFDFQTSTDGTAIVAFVKPVIDRIRDIPRRIINPKCGSNFGYQGEAVVESFDQFLEPNSINYFRVSPNYLFGSDEKIIKFQGYGFGNLVVCSSRKIEQPNQNATTGDVKCQTISGSNQITFSFSDPCSDYDTVSICPPVYFSVIATQVGEESNNFRCSESGCRFPDTVKYMVQVERLSCYSGSLKIVANAFLLLSIIVTVRFIY